MPPDPGNYSKSGNFVKLNDSRSRHSIPRCLKLQGKHRKSRNSCRRRRVGCTCVKLVLFVLFAFSPQFYCSDFENFLWKCSVFKAGFSQFWLRKGHLADCGSKRSHLWRFSLCARVFWTHLSDVTCCQICQSWRTMPIELGKRGREDKSYGGVWPVLTQKEWTSGEKRESKRGRD